MCLRFIATRAALGASRCVAIAALVPGYAAYDTGAGSSVQVDIQVPFSVVLCACGKPRRRQRRPRRAECLQHRLLGSASIRRQDGDHRQRQRKNSASAADSCAVTLPSGATTTTALERCSPSAPSSSSPYARASSGRSACTCRFFTTPAWARCRCSEHNKTHIMKPSVSYRSPTYPLASPTSKGLGEKSSILRMYDLW